jgi:hypothetical protein
METLMREISNIKDELPQYEIINGMKFETINSQKEYYSDILDSTDNKLKDYDKR